MMPCERCGASNQPQSRFCVSCGSPMPSAPALAPAPAHPSVPAQWGRPAAPEYPLGASPAAPHQPAPVPHGPSTSSNLAFAETASPPTRGEFERMQQQAAGHAPSPLAGGYPGHGAPRPAHGSGGVVSPMPVAPTNAPAAAMPAATAAMPGTSQDPAQVPEGAPRILSGFLVSFEGQPMGGFWPIFQGRNLIGREGAPVSLDIPIAHPTTSSRHAVLMASALPGRVKVEDLGSTNGTFVNDVRLARGQPVEVADGDRVRLGLFAAIIKIV
jgi:hypothetical protein